MKLTFLGTGGGRFTMIDQLRQTGGMYLEHSMNSENSLDRANASSSSSDGFSLYIDPGPGALVHALGDDIPVKELDALLVTHAHLDHYGDMKALIEAMTSGGDNRRGTLLVSESILEGAELDEKYVKGKGTYGTNVAPVLDEYHASLVEDVVPLTDGKTVDVGPFTLHCIETEHSDPRTIGFKLETEERTVGFTSDTELFDDLVEFFADCDVLVLNVMRPKEKPWKGHLNTEDAAEIVNRTEPEFAILQHFGSLFIYESVNEQQAWLEEQTDVDFLLAKDGMTINLEQPRQGLDQYFE